MGGGGGGESRNLWLLLANMINMDPDTIDFR